MSWTCFALLQNEAALNDCNDYFLFSLSSCLATQPFCKQNGHCNSTTVPVLVRANKFVRTTLGPL